MRIIKSHHWVDFVYSCLLALSEREEFMIGLPHVGFKLDARVIAYLTPTVYNGRPPKKGEELAFTKCIADVLFERRGKERPVIAVGALPVQSVHGWPNIYLQIHAFSPLAVSNMATDCGQALEKIMSRLFSEQLGGSPGNTIWIELSDHEGTKALVAGVYPEVVAAQAA